MGEGPAEVAAPLVDFPAAVGEDSPAALSVEAGFQAASALAVGPACDKLYTEKK